MKTDDCVICGETEDLHEHHWLPISMGGSDDWNNKIVICGKHHSIIHETTNLITLRKCIKRTKQNFKEEGVFLGGKKPFAHSLGHLIKYRNKRNIIKYKRKLYLDTESKEFQILKFIMLSKNFKYRRTKKNLFKYGNRKCTFRELHNLILRNFNRYLTASFLHKIWTRHKKDLDLWMEFEKTDNVDCLKKVYRLSEPKLIDRKFTTFSENNGELSKLASVVKKNNPTFIKNDSI